MNNEGLMGLKVWIFWEKKVRWEKDSIIWNWMRKRREKLILVSCQLGRLYLWFLLVSWVIAHRERLTTDLIYSTLIFFSFICPFNFFVDLFCFFNRICCFVLCMIVFYSLVLLNHWDKEKKQQFQTGDFSDTINFIFGLKIILSYIEIKVH